MQRSKIKYTTNGFTLNLQQINSKFATNLQQIHNKMFKSYLALRHREREDERGIGPIHRQELQIVQELHRDLEGRHQQIRQTRGIGNQG